MVMGNAMLSLGILLVPKEYFVQSDFLQTYFVFFILSVALPGIHHCFSGLLVASKNTSENKVFCKQSFILEYMGKMFFFALIFLIFPVPANLIFVICAVFYFRETILVRFTKVNLVKESFVIFYFLRKDELISLKSAVKQISFYSLILFFGFLVFSLTGLIFLNNHSFIAYVFLALAVLTAPHMLVMHNMYKSANFLPIIEKYS